MGESLRLRLPATSANLGPGFDALGLAMDFALHVDARLADTFTIRASGRDADRCGDAASSLVLQTYRSVLRALNRAAPPLHLDLYNEIPLGMGCGSSAAALVAGVALASHFGDLGWTRHEILTEASVREGHPDNVAACVMGGLTVSAMSRPEDGPPQVHAIALQPAAAWPLLLVIPKESLSTSKARALLPESYSKADAIFNVQRAAMLTAAFAQGRADLLAPAMQDRMHQPYRTASCPLLDPLQALAGKHGIVGVALSGAGPSVMLVVETPFRLVDAEAVVRDTLGRAKNFFDTEIFSTKVGVAAVL